MMELILAQFSMKQKQKLQKNFDIGSGLTNQIVQKCISTCKSIKLIESHETPQSLFSESNDKPL